MNCAEDYATKVPQVTLTFWIIKIAATTLGETGGDSVTMTLNWGYLAGTVLFLAALVVLVVAQIAAKGFHPLLYWATIIASTTFGTTMADFADRSLGIGYAGGSALLFLCLMSVLGLWYWSLGSISVQTVSMPKVEAFYWAAITFSQTLVPRSVTGRRIPGSAMKAELSSSAWRSLLSRRSTSGQTYPTSPCSGPRSSFRGHSARPSATSSISLYPMAV